MKRIAAGILAHVDAGKTTCIEGMLYKSGVIRKAGRVDHQDTVLDYDEQERDHGITIYAKEAHFTWTDAEIYVIDTPGHVDFLSEMERALRIIDIAVVLVNGQDGVQSHTETIWKCLEHYHIPTIVFLNKMDIAHYTKEELIRDLQKHCDENCIDWKREDKMDSLAMSDDALLEEYSGTGTIQFSHIQKAFQNRKFYPVLSGSALKMEGLEDLMDLMVSLSSKKEYPDAFGARVYKISEDSDGNRLIHVRITGGTLKARDKVSEDEKVDQIRLYNGVNYQMLQEAQAGMVVSIKGLHGYEAGDGLGFEENSSKPLLNACMNYELVLPPGANALVLADTMKELSEEDPQLAVNVDDKTKKIHVQIMGSMQKEVLQKKIQDKSGILAGFSAGQIVYMETIQNPVEGAGHFEPLRHYAEVHVRLEPAERGSGIHIVNGLSNDALSAVWQRSIISALQRKRHRGVLTGSYLTDVKITLIAAKGNIKHTSGGDFFQASSRAVRQALMKADNILLEPYDTFTLTLPSESLSRALYDLESRNASVEVNDNGDGTMTIKGRGPVRTLMNYQDDVIAYTHGKGRFNAVLDGYDVCNDAEEITEESGYDPDMDLHNPADSVFCANGSGYNVSWDKADPLMHIQLKKGESAPSSQNIRYKVSDDDLGYIMEMTSGRNRTEEKIQARKRKEEQEKKEEEKALRKVKAEKNLPELLIVDGYNMIYSWDSLKDIAYEDLSIARDKLNEYLFNFIPYLDHPIVVVYDGYKVKDNIGSHQTKGDLTVIYTKGGETADAWLEKSSYDLKGKYRVTYATSDALIQNAVFSQGGMRMPARQLEDLLKQKGVILS